MSTIDSPEKLAPERQLVALIAGPTASGKSDLAVALALEVQKRGGKARVINADSAQVYADLQVLSARPTLDEMCGIDHRLFGTWDGAQACSAAEWAAAAKEEITAAHEDGALPVLVGGTGLYIRTLLEGIAPIPPINPDIRAEVRAMDQPDAWAALQSEDSERAALLNAADRARVSRALEVVRSTGKPLAHWQAQLEGGIGAEIDLHPLILLPDREWLYARCELRFERMLDNGALAELEVLLARDLSPALPVMRAIGVAELTGWLRGEWTRDEAILRGGQSTRNYAKRQFTWFRRQPPEHWARHAPENVDIPALFEILLLKSGLT